MEEQTYMEKILEIEYIFLRDYLRQDKNLSIELFWGIGTAPQESFSNEIPIGWLTYLKQKKFTKIEKLSHFCCVECYPLVSLPPCQR